MLGSLISRCGATALAVAALIGVDTIGGTTGTATAGQKFEWIAVTPVTATNLPPDSLPSRGLCWAARAMFGRYVIARSGGL